MHISNQGINAVDIVPTSLEQAWALLKTLGEAFDDKTLELQMGGEQALNIIYATMNLIATAGSAAEEVARTWKPKGSQTSMKHSWVSEKQ